MRLGLDLNVARFGRLLAGVTLDGQGPIVLGQGGCLSAEELVAFAIFRSVKGNRCGCPNPRLDVLKCTGFNATYRFNLAEVNGGLHGFPPKPLPFPGAVIGSSFQTVDQRMVASCTVLVVGGRSQVHGPIVGDLQHLMFNDGGVNLAFARPRQDVARLADHDRVLVGRP